MCRCVDGGVAVDTIRAYCGLSPRDVVYDTTCIVCSVYNELPVGINSFKIVSIANA